MWNISNLWKCLVYFESARKCFLFNCFVCDVSCCGPQIHAQTCHFLLLLLFEFKVCISLLVSFFSMHNSIHVLMNLLRNYDIHFMSREDSKEYISCIIERYFWNSFAFFCALFLISRLYFKNWILLSENYDYLILVSCFEFNQKLSDFIFRNFVQRNFKYCQRIFKNVLFLSQSERAFIFQ